MLRYDFQADRPVDFNIHFHDGLTMHYPVELTRVETSADDFVADANRWYCLMWTNQGFERASLSYRIMGP